MKKWMMNIAILGIVSITTLSGTGCQAIKEQRDAEIAAHSYTLHNDIEEVISRDTTKWNKLIDTLGGKSGIFIDKLNSYYDVDDTGVYRANGYIDFLDSIDDQEDLLKEVIGPEVEAFIKSAKNLRTGQSLEQIIGGYGLSAIKAYEGDAKIFVCESGLTFKDKALQSKIDTLCNKNLFISAVSQGKEKRIVELAYPSYLPYRSHFFENTNSAYYKVFMDKKGNIEKVQLIICYLPDNDSVLSEEKYADLKNILQQMSSKEIEISELQKVIEENMKQKSKNSRGTLDDLSYSVTKKVSESWQKEMTVVEIE